MTAARAHGASPRFVTSPRLAALAAAALATSLLLGCGGGKKKANTPVATPSVAAATVRTAQATATVPATGSSPVLATPTAFPQATLRPGTPLAGSPTPAATPGASPTPGVRTENGLQIQDVAYTGKVTTSGGLRIHSAPSVSSSVVGSVPEGAAVNVEGKVLNGEEAEAGKGKVWCIVGIQQYMYCPEGYVTNVGTPAPPAPAGTPAR
ncbi:MAG TPA: hypothetical protein VFD32_16300 [Dehalococcoidia bacterium]|nr:hypothetical protein [Dehalococcoidia bacterium]